MAEERDFEGFWMSCNHWWVIAVSALIIGGGGLITISLVQTLLVSSHTEYGIVFDAGSSHTEMAIYKWPGQYLNGTGKVTQVQECRASPLEVYTEEPEKAGDALKKCLNFAKVSIPPSSHAGSNVYLGATAGLRLLRMSDPKTTQIVFMSIRDTISGYRFKFTNESQQARIITGLEEGTFGWVTANYLGGKLEMTPKRAVVKRSAKERHDMYGALDMGGASAEIAFVPDPSATIPADYHSDVKLYGTHHSLYTHSYLCYGIVEASRLLRAQLAQESGYNSTVYNPCSPDGNVSYVSYDEIFGNHPCTQHLSSKVPALSQNETFQFEGTSDPDKCFEVVLRLFNFSHCNRRNCSFNGVYQPPVTGQFLAYSAYYYVMEFLNLTDTNHSLADFTNETRNLCSLPWDQVKELPTNFSSGLSIYCFEAVFIHTILTAGFGFSEKNWQTIHFVDKIAGSSVGWSLGFMLTESNLIPEEPPTSPMSNTVFTLAMFLLVVVIFFSIGFACYAFRKRSRLRAYTPL